MRTLFFSSRHDEHVIDINKTLKKKSGIASNLLAARVISDCDTVDTCWPTVS